MDSHVFYKNHSVNVNSNAAGHGNPDISFEQTAKLQENSAIQVG